jgi:hypothetical protein
VWLDPTAHNRELLLSGAVFRPCHLLLYVFIPKGSAAWRHPRTQEAVLAMWGKRVPSPYAEVAWPLQPGACWQPGGSWRPADLPWPPQGSRPLPSHSSGLPSFTGLGVERRSVWTGSRRISHSHSQRAMPQGHVWVLMSSLPVAGVDCSPVIYGVDSLYQGCHFLSFSRLPMGQVFLFFFY